MGEPAGVAHHHVELVAVHDKKGLAVGGRVQHVVFDLDAAELHADEIAGEFVVVAGHEHDAGALAHLAQQFLHHVIVGLRPVPAALQPPAVDDVADEKKLVGVVVPEEIEQKFSLAAACAQMNVGNEQRAVAPGRDLFVVAVHNGAHDLVFRSCIPFCCQSIVASR